MRRPSLEEHAMAGTSLQFDHAQFDGAPAAACALCHQSIVDSYYEIGGQVSCSVCRASLERSMSSEGRVGRVLRATALGLAAAAVGAAVWYGVRAATGYEVGFIAILVGVLVGSAVKRGSGGRGGWAYQTLAIALTYLSIVSTYVPVIASTFLDKAKQHEAAKPKTDVAPPAAPGRGVVRTVVVLGVALAVLLAFACAAPFLAGAQNIVGIFIIGIGLYEAWKINRKVTVVITGPHRVAEPALASAAVG
jgi:hypothetical protein